MEDAVEANYLGLYEMRRSLLEAAHWRIAWKLRYHDNIWEYWVLEQKSSRH